MSISMPDHECTEMNVLIPALEVLIVQWRNAFVMKRSPGDGGLYRGSQEHRIAQQKYLNSLGKVSTCNYRRQVIKSRQSIANKRKVCVRDQTLK